MAIKLTFEETVEFLIGRHSTNLTGNYEWIDWDAIYFDLVDEGWETSEASILLDSYMDKMGY